MTPETFPPELQNCGTPEQEMFIREVERRVGFSRYTIWKIVCKYEREDQAFLLTEWMRSLLGIDVSRPGIGPGGSRDAITDKSPDLATSDDLVKRLRVQSIHAHIARKETMLEAADRIERQSGLLAEFRIAEIVALEAENTKLRKRLLRAGKDK